MTDPLLLVLSIAGLCAWVSSLCIAWALAWDRGYEQGWRNASRRADRSHKFFVYCETRKGRLTGYGKAEDMDLK